MDTQFINDVDAGLSQTPKSLPSKYFYDSKGDALFVDIMNMPEYYLTRAEMEIFSQQTEEIIKGCGVLSNTHFELIELGAGDGTKTSKLLTFLSRSGFSFDYIPIDISSNALVQLADTLSQTLPQVNVIPEQGDYFKILSSLKYRPHPKVVLFLGSNIGNMDDLEAIDFLQQLGSSLQSGDKLVLGVDLIKPEEIVLPAYNDRDGVTERFNMNLLQRINNELGGNFDLHNFAHAPSYNEQEGIARSQIKSLKEQKVTLQANNKTYLFSSGEMINTEISRKYNDDIIVKITKDSKFTLVDKLMDSNQYFADYIFSVKGNETIKVK